MQNKIKIAHVFFRHVSFFVLRLKILWNNNSSALHAETSFFLVEVLDWLSQNLKVCFVHQVRSKQQIIKRQNKKWLHFLLSISQELKKKIRDFIWSYTSRIVNARRIYSPDFISFKVFESENLLNFFPWQA